MPYWAEPPEVWEGSPARLNNGASREKLILKSEEAAYKKPPLHYLCSAPVWPSGDWLPLSGFERAKQVGG